MPVRWLSPHPHGRDFFLRTISAAQKDQSFILRVRKYELRVAEPFVLCRTLVPIMTAAYYFTPWTVTTTLLPNIFGSHVKKAGPSASGTQQQFYEAGDKLMDSHCFLLFFAISSNLLKKLCQFCAAGAKSLAFQFIYSSYNCKTRPVLVPHIVCKAGSF